MHPSDVAGIVRALPLSRRRQLAAAMDDDRLADLFEELPEDEQLRLIEGLDLDRLIDVLDEMEYDDLADLLGEMTGAAAAAILEAMDDEEADVLRRLLAYEESDRRRHDDARGHRARADADRRRGAGPDPRPGLGGSIAAQVFVCQPPFKAPTGKFLGTAHVQRLLREAPSLELRHCVSNDPVVGADATDRAVAELLASYDMLAVAVRDPKGQRSAPSPSTTCSTASSAPSGVNAAAAPTSTRTAQRW